MVVKIIVLLVWIPLKFLKLHKLIMIMFALLKIVSYLINMDIVKYANQIWRCIRISVDVLMFLKVYVSVVIVIICYEIMAVISRSIIV